MIICCLLFSLNAAAQEQETTDSLSTQETKTSLMTRLHQLQEYLDTKAKKKVDPAYIEVPDKPWRVILRYKENAVDVDYSQNIESPDANAYSDWNLCFEPPVASSIGFWVGYRGTGFSYSKSLTKNAGRYYSFSTTGAKYGFNFRLRRFKTDDARLTARDYENEQITYEFDDDVTMPAPVWIRSVYINGYYVFNGRRYSFITEGRFFCYRAVITKEPSPCMFRSPKCESITEDRIESNLSKTKNIPPKAVIFSDFICTFAMSLMILLVLICSTKVSEKSDMAKS